MPKALITGINGFTGRHLALELTQAGYDVVGLTHQLDGSIPWRIEACDISDRSALKALLSAEQPDVIAHLAAISFVAHGDASAMYTTNVIGSRNLLEAIAETCNPKQILLCSSANIYGNASVEVIDEAVIAAPANDYAVSKLSMEYVASLWPQLPITIVRPFNYTGVWQHEKFLIPKIVSHFKRNASVIELGNLDVERDFSDVRMVVDSYRRLLELDSSGQVYNIASGHGYSLTNVLETMCELAGYRPEIRVNPAFVRQNEVRKLVGNNAKLRRAIGDLKTIELRDTLRWMLESEA